MTPQTDPVRAGYRGSALPDRSGGTSPAAAVAGAFRGNRGKAVTFGGITFKSQAALARALGLSKSNVSFAARNGRLNTLGSGSKAGAELAKGARCQPVAAHGWHWPSQKAAAKALKCHQDTIGKNLNRGTFDAFVLKRLGVKA